MSRRSPLVFENHQLQASESGFALLFLLLLCFSNFSNANPTRGSIASEYGCDLEYEVYLPADTASAGIEVLLAHGFKRNLATMRGWAEHWQALGISTTIMTFCNSSWFNGHHQRNANDLLALATHLGMQSPVYAGYSAGGLAAYIAALQDSRTRAYLGLDAVDSGNLAEDATTLLERPALFITAKPSLCNAKGNLEHVIARYGAVQRIHISEATHCDFEWPFDKRCNLVCGKNDEAVHQEAQTHIQALATEWLLSLPAVADEASPHIIGDFNLRKTPAEPAQ